jgi:hypothetical protein
MHTTTLTFVLMAWDRLRFIRHPTKARMPAFVCIIGTWLASVCFVLPYPIYIIYIDLGVSIPDNLFVRFVYFYNTIAHLVWQSDYKLILTYCTAREMRRTGNNTTVLVKLIIEEAFCGSIRLILKVLSDF